MSTKEEILEALRRFPMDGARIKEIIARLEDERKQRLDLILPELMIPEAPLARKAKRLRKR